MKKLVTLAAFGALLAVSAFADTLSGTISDANCAAKHAGATASDEACVKKCVKGGAAAVLISGGKTYQISVDSMDKTKDFLGKKVTVTGKVEGDTVTIESIQGSKS